MVTAKAGTSMLAIEVLGAGDGDGEGGVGLP
jgi:hypothetical protein